MNANMNKWFWLGFAAIWTVLVVFSYWSFHPNYAVAFGDLPNAGMAFVLLAVSAGVWYTLQRTKIIINGIRIYGFLLFLQMLVFGIYASSMNIFPDGVGQKVTYFLAFNVLLHVATAFIFLVHYALGEWVVRHLATKISSSSIPVLSLAVGISISGFILVLLGLAGVLHGWVIWVLAGTIVLLQRKKVLDILRLVLLKPMTPPSEYKWSTVPVFLMLIAMAVNNVGIVQAFPVGFDGAGLYMNTSHLIAQSHALPLVGQAFNWEIFMSLGELMFGLVPLSILLSHLAIVLVVFAMYRLGRLFMGKGASWLAVALLYVNPAFAFHAGLDSKIDLGLLFIILSTLLLITEYYFTKQDPNITPEPVIRIGKVSISQQVALWSIAGWLCGYAFGVKYTALFVMIAVIAAYYYKSGGLKQGAGALLLGIGALYLTGIDRFAYLDLGGSSSWIVALIALIPGSMLFVWGIVERGTPIKQLVKLPVLFVLFALFAFSPWMGKHYVENKKFSISALVQGKKGIPVLVEKSFRAPESQKANLQKQKVISALENLGIELDQQQLVNAEAIISGFDFVNLDPQSRLNALLQARNGIIAQVLTEEQRTMVNGVLANSGQDANMIKEDSEAALSLVQRIFDRRGITLSAEQLSQIREKLDFSILQGIQIKGNKEWATSFKADVFANVLSVSQKDQMAGRRQAGDVTEESGAAKPTLSLAEVQREEIQRYIGYEKGLPLYMSLPYDITMNTNVSFSRYLDISFLLLLLLPFLFWSGNLLKNSLVSLLSIVFWVVAVYSVYVGKDITSASAFGEIIRQQTGTHPGMLSAMILPVFESIQWAIYNLGKSMDGLYTSISSIRYMWIVLVIFITSGLCWWALKSKLHAVPIVIKFIGGFLLAFGLQWFLFGNAIIWYGFTFFAGMFLIMAYLAYQPEHFGLKILSGWVGNWWRISVGLSLILGLSIFFVSGIQEQSRAAYLFQTPFLKYASQRQSLQKTQAQFMPYMDNVITTLNADTKSNIYRVGTFFHYHIARNDRRVLEDNQLGVFAQITDKLENKEDFIRILKESGFRYILFDINTAAIDKTPEKSLTRKANEFYLTLSGSTLVRPLFTDNFIKDPAVPFTKVGDVNVPGRPGMGGETTMIGHFILFEIL
jgi:hypothetical protein